MEKDNSIVKDYKKRILDCIEELKRIRFPCEDWKKDKVFFDKLEKEFSEEAEDEETKQLLIDLHNLIYEKRMFSLNFNKTDEELFSGFYDGYRKFP